MEIRRFFGLSAETRCDRCHVRITSPSDVYTLCNNCFLINPQKIREHEVKLEYSRLIEGLTCVLCKANVNNAQQNHSCYKCVFKHPDRAHSGWYIYSDYKVGTKLYRSCICGDVLIITIGQSHEFEYYKVGNRKPVSVPYLCSRNVRSHVYCEHDWLVLAENDTPYEIGVKKYLEYKQNPAMGLLLDIEDEFEHMAFGSTKFWCSRCGLFHDLSPSKVKLLPRVGYHNYC